jgi:hypothetical protein
MDGSSDNRKDIPQETCQLETSFNLCYYLNLFFETETGGFNLAVNLGKLFSLLNFTSEIMIVLTK